MKRLLLGLLAGTALEAASAAPLTLEAAMAAAEAQAPALAAAAADADAADHRAAAARAAAGPSATLTGSIGWGRLDPGGYFGLTASDVTPRAAQVGIEQPLYAGGRIAGARQAARAGTDAAGAALRQSRMMLRADVAEAFGAVRAADAGLDAAEQLTRAIATAARQAALRFKSGEVPATDAQQAQARLAEAEAVAAQAAARRDTARARLARLTGLAPGELAPLPDAPPLPATVDAALQEAETRAPALAQAAAALAAAEGEARMARAQGLPQVAAYAEASTVRDQFFPGYRGDLASAGLRARWAFFASGRVRAEGEAADAGVRAARARLDDARGRLREQVIGSFAGVRAAALAAEAARRQREASAAALASVRAEVRVGLKPTLALLDAEREAAQAALRASEADAARSTAAWRLLALIGRDIGESATKM